MALTRRHAPLLFLVAVEAAWCTYLAVTRTIPRGHDGFQYFYLKYYFFNDYVRLGEIAQWVPYLTHGSPGTWWYVVQSGVFDPLALIVARLLGLTNFFPIFYTLLFLEKVLLVVGTWLLAGEHIQSRPARFAVTAAVSATCIWYLQPWWNFHAVLALPLMLFCLHRVITDFRWTWLVSLSLLLFAQTFGHLSYYLPMTLLFLAIYCIQMLSRSEARLALRNRFRWSTAGAAAVAIVNIAFLADLLWLRSVSQTMAFAGSQRGADGSVSIDTFLNYGAGLDLRTWNEFLLGLTPHMDFTFFAGFFTVGLVIVALASGPLNKAQKIFATLAALTVLIAAASPVATVVYYVWPLARLFRHLTLLLPIAGFFSIFLAGATFDRLVHDPAARAWRPRVTVVLVVVFGSTCALLIAFALGAAHLRDFLRGMESGSLPVIDTYGQEFVSWRMVRGVASVTLTGIVLGALHVKDLPQTRIRALARIAAILFFLDVSTYAWLEMRSRTVSLGAREAAVFQFTDLPYAERRVENITASPNARHRTFAKSSARMLGSRYETDNMLWMIDAYQASSMTVFWSASFDSLLQALNMRPAIAPIPTFPLLEPSTKDDLVATIAGFRESKIRLLKRAIFCPDAASTALLLSRPAYRAQVALLTAGTTADPAPTLPDVLPCDIASIREEAATLPTSAEAHMVAFSSNRAGFDVTNPTDAPLVMTYSDTWSEGWTARIDGNTTTLFRSDLAYKAVVVPAGHHRVDFEYRDRMADIVLATQRAASVGIVVLLGFLFPFLRES